MKKYKKTRNRKTRNTKKFRCFCCNQLTLKKEPNVFSEICPECQWEGSGAQFLEELGFNTGVRRARENYRRYGVCDPRGKPNYIKRLPSADDVTDVYGKFCCPCCGCRTLEDRPNGTFELCPVCFWEDDREQIENPDARDSFSYYANFVSFNEARKNYRKYGVSDPNYKDYVRKPRDDELQ